VDAILSLSTGSAGAAPGTDERLACIETAPE
jgi:hypothetical protein